MKILKKSLFIFAIILFASNSYAGRTNFLINHADKIGLYFFYDAACEYCHMQLPIVEQLHKAYGISVLIISENGCPTAKDLPCSDHPELFTKFHVIYHPVIIMVYRGQSGKPIFHQIGIGLTDFNTLTSRIYYYTKHRQGGN